MMASVTATCLLLVFVVCLPSPAQGAGMNTHVWVGELTRRYYGEIRYGNNAEKYTNAIANNPDCIQGGADFPDFLYACGSNHSAGEAAHWPPWQAAAVKYIRSKPDFINGNWTKDTEKLVVFIFGVSVHYMADEFWEGLNGQIGRGQGFVRTLSSFNLNHSGLNDNDEGVANFAADFDVSFALNESSIKPWDRYFPAKEIQEIYKVSGNNNVSLESLDECRVLFDLGLWAEMVFGGILFRLYSEVFHHVPFVSEHFEDLPIGGLDDMAVWAGFVWQRVARWLGEGAPINPPPNAYEKQQNNTKKPVEREEWIATLVHLLKPLKHIAPLIMNLDVKNMISINSDNSICYQGPQWAQQHLQHVITSLATSVLMKNTTVKLKTCTEEQRKPNKADPLPKPIATLVGDSGHEYFGHSVTSGDFNGDGNIDVVVTAPGTGTPHDPQVGACHVYYNFNTNGSASEIQVLSGEKVHGRFGWKASVVDYNLDGIDDLVVTAPLAALNKSSFPLNDSTPHLKMWGAVYIYTGNKQTGLSTVPTVTIKNNDDLTYAGWTLDVADVNGDGHDDILVGAPLSSFRTIANISDEDSVRRGGLYVFFSKPTTKTTTTSSSLVLRKDCDICLEGPSPYGWFGQSMDTANSTDSNDRWLIVGSPGYRHNGTVGRVYVYNISSLIQKKNEPPFTITGVEVVAEFGYQVAVSRMIDGCEILAMATPSGGAQGLQSRTGRVNLVNLDENFGKIAKSGAEISIKDLKWRALIEDEHSLTFGRLGFEMSWTGPDKNNLVLGAPLLGGRGGDGDHEAGGIFMWRSNKLPEGMISDVASNATWGGWGAHALGRTGSSFTMIDSNNILVANPFSTKTGDEIMAGSVDMFNIKIS
eukprot:m.278609 g.278609  ORF g.278609 m.278609 type:complete len:870 (+) comp16316_c1_seq3:130-2739(+)